MLQSTNQIYNMKVSNGETPVQKEEQELLPEKHKYTQAKAIPIYNVEQTQLEKYRAIVNAEDINKVFAIATKGYQVVQHDQLIETVDSALETINLKHSTRVIEENDGARIHMDISFPDNKLTIDGENVSLNIAWDNSYDLSTGLRITVSATDSRGVRYYVPKSYASYYHKHTKGLKIEKVKKSLEEGVEVFDKKVSSYFNELVASQTTTDKAIVWLEKCLEDEVISKKYLEEMRDILKQRKSFSIKNKEVTNLWSLYSLISEVLGKSTASTDSKQAYAVKLAKRLSEAK